VEYPGAVYHIISRGNERKSIYKNDADRLLFLNIFSQTIKRFQWLCHGYVLMDNHYHLLIETPEPNLSRGMRQLNGVYTQDFNRIHRRAGHLFQGRFKAVLVDKDDYLLEVSRYIVLNPVKAGLIKSPGEWEWSSYGAMAGIISPPEFLTVDWIRSQFGSNNSQACQGYKKFVFRGIMAEYPMEALSGQVLLGSRRFVRSIAGHVKQKLDEKEIPRNQRISAGDELEEIFQKGARQGDSRDAIIYQAYAEGNYSMREIGDFLGLHYSSISLAIKRYEDGRESI
jgi:REP element-mobilizing transposase RayT